MQYREIIAVCSQIHTKHKYTVWTAFLMLTLMVHKRMRDSCKTPYVEGQVIVMLL